MPDPIPTPTNTDFSPTILTKQIKPSPRVEEIQTESKAPAQPNQQHVIPFDPTEIEADVELIDLDPNDSCITVEAIQNHSRLPKNTRCGNIGNHQCNLKSNVACSTSSMNYIYRDDGKKETIDSLL